MRALGQPMKMTELDDVLRTNISGEPTPRQILVAICQCLDTK